MDKMRLIVFTTALFVSISTMAQSGDTLSDEEMLDGAPDAVDSAPVAQPPMVPANHLKAMDKIEMMKISRAEVIAFMKAGGLKSRVLR